MDAEKTYLGIPIVHDSQIIDIPYEDVNEEGKAHKKKGRKVRRNRDQEEHIEQISDDEEVVEPNDEVIRRNFNIMTNESKTIMFWGLISRFSWTCRSDKIFSDYDVEKIAKTFSKLEKIVFKEIYVNIMNDLKNILSDSIKMKNVSEREEIEYYGHIIAMGKQWYDNLIEHPYLAEFLISDGEMQLFYSALPEELK